MVAICTNFKGNAISDLSVQGQTSKGQSLHLATFSKQFGLTRALTHELARQGIVRIQQGGYVGDNLHHEKVVTFDEERVRQYLAGQIEPEPINLNAKPIYPSLRKPRNHLIPERLPPLPRPIPFICPKCGKVTTNIHVVRRRSLKMVPAKVYIYVQWRHRDNRKHGGFIYHYKPYDEVARVPQVQRETPREGLSGRSTE